MKKSIFLIFKTLFVVLIILIYSPVLKGQTTSGIPAEIFFNHDDIQLHGWFYKAGGTGPFPTVVLLHGSVGQDGAIFNLGERLSKEGFNVMAYNYPGLWRSEGSVTNLSALGSVQSAINFVKSEYAMQTFDSDTSDIILIVSSPRIRLQVNHFFKLRFETPS